MLVQNILPYMPVIKVTNLISVLTTIVKTYPSVRSPIPVELNVRSI